MRLAIEVASPRLQRQVQPLLVLFRNEIFVDPAGRKRPPHQIVYRPAASLDLRDLRQVRVARRTSRCPWLRAIDASRCILLCHLGSLSAPHACQALSILVRCCQCTPRQSACQDQFQNRLRLVMARRKTFYSPKRKEARKMRPGASSREIEASQRHQPMASRTGRCAMWERGLTIKGPRHGGQEWGAGLRRSSVAQQRRGRPSYQ